MSESQTPRTDEAVQGIPNQNRLSPFVSARFARQLESELTTTRARLAESERKLSVVAKAVDIAERINNESSEMQVALSASFEEAIAHIMLEQTKEKLAKLKARLAELEGIAERLGRAVDVSLKAVETAYERSSGMLRGFMGGKIDEVKAILAYKEGKK